MDCIGQDSPGKGKVGNIVLLLLLILFSKNLYIVVERIEAVCQCIDVSADLMRCKFLPSVIHFVGKYDNLLLKCE